MPKTECPGIHVAWWKLRQFSFSNTTIAASRDQTHNAAPSSPSQNSPSLCLGLKGGQLPPSSKQTYTKAYAVSSSDMRILEMRVMSSLSGADARVRRKCPGSCDKEVLGGPGEPMKESPRGSKTFSPHPARQIAQLLPKF